MAMEVRSLRQGSFNEAIQFQHFYGTGVKCSHLPLPSPGTSFANIKQQSDRDLLSNFFSHNLISSTTEKVILIQTSQQNMFNYRATLVIIATLAVAATTSNTHAFTTTSTSPAFARNTKLHVEEDDSKGVLGTVKDKAIDAKDYVKDKAGDVKDYVKDKAGDVKDKAVDAKDYVKDRAGDAKGYVKDKAGDIKDAVVGTEETAEDKLNDARDKFDDATDTVGDAFDDASDNVGDAFEDAGDKVKNAKNDIADAADKATYSDRK
jgi:gas vesicle protein